ncbi:zinc knuckle domain-containing protein [Ophiostoma piceae UAMH 11346]|uniref:Zinc knuckle domain-containing protein n=1 Tax=Ophiostoma piceae (strain UAMH 11346) TaxID=1262450 RepID=S3CH42_OPHP1|nr:zinc knuckle domain-containing protein [Ophiostoma piceae UAMH 11346]
MDFQGQQGQQSGGGGGRACFSSGLPHLAYALDITSSASHLILLLLVEIGATVLVSGPPVQDALLCSRATPRKAQSSCFNNPDGLLSPDALLSLVASTPLAHSIPVFTPLRPGSKNMYGLFLGKFLEIGGATTHQARDCPNRGAAKCYNCGNEGHMSRDCPEGPKDTKTCYRCGQSGHISRDCPSSAGGDSRGQGQSGAECYKCGEAWEILSCSRGESYTRIGHGIDNRHLDTQKRTWSLIL